MIASRNQRMMGWAFGALIVGLYGSRSARASIPNLLDGARGVTAARKRAILPCGKRTAAASGRLHVLMTRLVFEVKRRTHGRRLHSKNISRMDTWKLNGRRCPCPRRYALYPDSLHPRRCFAPQIEQADRGVDSRPSANERDFFSWTDSLLKGKPTDPGSSVNKLRRRQCPRCPPPTPMPLKTYVWRCPRNHFASNADRSWDAWTPTFSPFHVV